ncbi:hypothetical protein, partial [Mycolicibacterium fallax]
MFLLGAVAVGTLSSLYLGTVMQAAQYRIKRPGWQLVGILAFVGGLVVIWGLGEATMAIGLTWGRKLFGHLLGRRLLPVPVRSEGWWVVVVRWWGAVLGFGFGDDGGAFGGGLGGVGGAFGGDVLGAGFAA